MSVFRDGVIAFFSAVGMTTVVWLLAGAVLLMLRCGLYPLARRAILIRRRQNQQACVSAESARY